MKFALTILLTMAFFNSAYAEFPGKGALQYLKKYNSLRRTRSMDLNTALNMTQFEGIMMPKDSELKEKVTQILKNLSEGEIAEFKKRMRVAHENFLHFESRTPTEAIEASNKFGELINQYFNRLPAHIVNIGPAISASKKVKAANAAKTAGS